MVDHIGWKWWRKKRPDLEQVALELIDVWHFGLSDCIQRLGIDGATQFLSTVYKDALSQPKIDMDQSILVRVTEEFAASTLSTRTFQALDFFRLTAACKLDMDRIYETYVAKNVLNFFRQDHGYNDGTYTKIWDGREDNEHLIELLGEIDQGTADFADQLYKQLDQRYRKSVKAAL